MIRIAFRTVAPLAIVALSAIAAANPGTYTVKGIGSGTFNGKSFSNSEISIVAMGDTANRTQTGTDYYLVATSNTVTITGLGSDTFTDSIEAVSSQGGQLGGISNATLNLAILLVNDPNFAGYDLSTSFGPVTGPASFNPGIVFSTAGGSLQITSMNRTTFTADVQAVPEPASMAALGLGVLAIARKRRAASK